MTKMVTTCDICDEVMPRRKQYWGIGTTAGCPVGGTYEIDACDTCIQKAGALYLAKFSRAEIEQGVNMNLYEKQSPLRDFRRKVAL